MGGKFSPNSADDCGHAAAQQWIFSERRYKCCHENGRRLRGMDQLQDRCRLVCDHVSLQCIGELGHRRRINRHGWEATSTKHCWRKWLHGKEKIEKVEEKLRKLRKAHWRRGSSRAMRIKEALTGPRSQTDWGRPRCIHYQPCQSFKYIVQVGLRHIFCDYDGRWQISEDRRTRSGNLSKMEVEPEGSWAYWELELVGSWANWKMGSWWSYSYNKI